MKKLFIHKPLFRLLSPVFSGVVVYLLILLVNNNVAQIEQEFLGQELYVCIGLSYIVQEFLRFSLLQFKRFLKSLSTPVFILIQVFVTILLCIGIVSLFMTIYYKKVLGFSPNFEELLLFNSIFSVVSAIYILLFISHEYLHKINTDKLKEEQQYLQFIEEDFQEFKQGINPSLLFESLENLLVLIQNDTDLADDFIDHLATIYRYILSSKEKQLVTIQEELETTNELVHLFNYLPYRNITMINEVKSDFLVVPRSLLFTIEQIIRTTIISSNLELKIELKETENSFILTYLTNDKITAPFTLQHIKEIERVYKIYSDIEIQLITTDLKRTITLPKLTTKTEEN
ncbi:histidine kinase [uncultured Tenacibaculum sp.]|uniref:histidine kinase n=1 Tax=uncultured Tenacibaculum sp. TaxID=174713 RepID=UPI00262FE0C8|nr:histidine kinase [uncultured Tenacibaculum sp.]